MIPEHGRSFADQSSSEDAETRSELKRQTSKVMSTSTSQVPREDKSTAPSQSTHSKAEAKKVGGAKSEAESKGQVDRPSKHDDGGRLTSKTSTTAPGTHRSVESRRDQDQASKKQRTLLSDQQRNSTISHKATMDRPSTTTSAVKPTVTSPDNA